LIDVFEASRFAFTFWLLMGVVIGTLQLYKKQEIDLSGAEKGNKLSDSCRILYIYCCYGFFSPMLNNYFVGTISPGSDGLLLVVIR